MPNAVERRLRLPELLLGLVAVAVAVVVTGLVVAHAIRDVKRARDTITVTGSARQPISADIVHWSLAVSAEATRPEQAVRLLRTRVTAVPSLLRRAALPPPPVPQPPVAAAPLLPRLAP